ncbi:trypsin [Anopheles gambiae]|uniref:Peptidase S1 domain-containing protein n=1 Tax=Anopheles coluzzii TaxID=1518534 RepID=A0A8W7PY03_ANOCL|nr:trypsin-like [Anopheles coluzzii]XP_316523.5 trypsin [Anopheles gambiae]
MKHTTVYSLLALALLLTTTVSGQRYTLAEQEEGYEPFLPFIAGGTNAVNGQFPSIVAVGLPAPPNNAFCGGVILNENHVLTAARCVLTPQNTLLFANQLNILSGMLQLNFGAPRIGITAVYVHPQYNPFTFEHNIAVLRTSSNFFFPVVPVPNVDFAQFYEEIAFDGQPCQVVGWNNGTATPVQQFINAPILNRDTCNGLAVHLGNIRESMVCAGATNAGPGVCASNLGTGLFCEGRLAGILSTGLGCGQANNPGVYTQIRYYLPWIREQFSRQDIPLGGTSPIPVM